MGVFDYEAKYASNLMAYLSQKKNCSFELSLFTSVERLNAWLQENTLHILLISEQAFPEIKEPEKIFHIFLLSEEDKQKQEDKYPRIFKFQSAERIFLTMVSYLEEGLQKSEQKDQAEASVGIFGVISPNGGSGKTTFALAFTQALASTGPALYLSFEELGSSIGSVNLRSGMSDVIYYLKQRQKGLLAKIQTLATTMGGADYLFAVAHYSDLRALEKTDIDYLIGEFRRTGVYQNIVFDFGSLDDTVFHTLGFCRKIYVTHLHTALGISKEASFERLLYLEEKEDLENRIELLTLPWDERIAGEGVVVERLLEGELGAFIHELRQRTG